MSLTISRRPQILIAACALALLAMFVVMAQLSSTPSRTSVLRALERPALVARTTVGGTTVNASIKAQPYAVGLRISPNRAAAHDRFSVKLTDAGRVIDGATVTVTFSMPSMGMWHVYTSRLSSAGKGNYSAREPVLGMPGLWQLSTHVVRPGAAAIDVIVDDQMPA